MAVFAKFDGLKRPPVSTNVSMYYKTVSVILNEPRAQGALQQAGFSRAGLDELVNAKPLSNPNDRKIAGIIIAAAVSPDGYTDAGRFS